MRFVCARPRACEFANRIIPANLCTARSRAHMVGNSILQLCAREQHILCHESKRWRLCTDGQLWHIDGYECANEHTHAHDHVNTLALRIMSIITRTRVVTNPLLPTTAILRVANGTSDAGTSMVCDDNATEQGVSIS